MNKNLVITAVLGAITIMLGAFGAHGLKGKISPEAMQSFETAVRYQMYHIIVLLLVNMFTGFSIESKNIVSYFFLAGIICFSGSIFLTTFTKIEMKSIWFVTPFGGLMFIIGWVLLAIKFWK